MGDALRAFFQTVSELLTPKNNAPPAPPTVGVYSVDYSALTNAQIAAAATCEDVFKEGNWVSVNRKS